MTDQFNETTNIAELTGPVLAVEKPVVPEGFGVLSLPLLINQDMTTIIFNGKTYAVLPEDGEKSNPEKVDEDQDNYAKFRQGVEERERVKYASNPESLEEDDVLDRVVRPYNANFEGMALAMVREDYLKAGHSPNEWKPESTEHGYSLRIAREALLKVLAAGGEIQVPYADVTAKEAPKREHRVVLHHHDADIDSILANGASIGATWNGLMAASEPAKPSYEVNDYVETLAHQMRVEAGEEWPKLMSAAGSILSQTKTARATLRLLERAGLQVKHAKA